MQRGTWVALLGVLVVSMWSWRASAGCGGGNYDGSVYAERNAQSVLAQRGSVSAKRNAQSVLSQRNQIALDYVKNDTQFRDKVNAISIMSTRNLVGTAAQVSGSVLASKLAASVFEAIDAAKLAAKGHRDGLSAGLALEIINKAFKTTLYAIAETHVPGSGGAVKGAIALTEISAAFMTSYTYGFFFSPEAKALKAQ